MIGDGTDKVQAVHFISKYSNYVHLTLLSRKVGNWCLILWYFRIEELGGACIAISYSV